MTNETNHPDHPGGAGVYVLFFRAEHNWHLVFFGLSKLHDRLRNLGISERAGVTALFIKGDIMLTQEMLNEIMVRPGEQRERPKHKPMSCPACHEEYLGDGVVMCIDCEIERKESVECPVKDSGRG